jgi:hypothetical protein
MVKFQNGEEFGGLLVVPGSPRALVKTPRTPGRWSAAGSSEEDVEMKGEIESVRCSPTAARSSSHPLCPKP